MYSVRAVGGLCISVYVCSVWCVLVVFGVCGADVCFVWCVVFGVCVVCGLCLVCSVHVVWEVCGARGV